MKTLLVCGMVMAACAAPAMADNPSGPYVGGGYGRFHLNIHNLNDVGQAIDTITDSNDNAYKIFAGWRLTPNWAIEGAYVNFGHPGERFTATGSDGRYSVHMDGFSPTLLGSVPLGPVELFGEVGYLFYNVHLTTNFNAPVADVVESTHTRSNFLYGGGVAVTFFDHLNLRAEYQQLDLSRYQNSNALWLVAAWRF